MDETRDFPTEVIASLATGTLLCEFAVMHEAAEFLMGHPIWTHHFASEVLWKEMQQTILAQCPDMPVSIEGVTVENYREKVAEIVERIGPIVKIRKGGGLTALLPTDGTPDHLKDKTIVIKHE